MESKMNLKYLDLLERKLDEQQMAALSAKGNVIVAAGAGSGKTQVLATRFAYLVMSYGIKAEKILTLTFTKKAASEMYQRIYKTLEFFANNPDVPSPEKERAAEAVSDFARVHIQTLDSYNSSVLKQCASRYGIRPDFTQGDLGSGNDAFEYVMKRRDSEVIHYLVNEKNSGNLQKIAEDIQKEIMKRSTLASSSENFLRLCMTKKAGCLNQWKENRTKVLEGIASYFNGLEDVESNTKTVNECTHTMERLGNYLETFPDNFDSESFDTFQDFIKFIDGLKFNLPSGKGTDVVKEIVTQIRPDNKDGPISKMKLAASYLKDFPNHLAYANFLDEYLIEVNIKKRTSGKLSFSDISEMALKALTEQDDLRTQEQNAYDRIMIDEFQDNNKKNRNLLFLISGKPGLSAEEILKGKKNLMPEKLFFVGDDKQSIYKFRGADVSVFKELGEDLETVPVNMVFNYRSTEYLLDSFNHIFGGFDREGKKLVEYPGAVFPESVDEDQTFVATFTKDQIAKRNMKVLKTSPVEFKNSPVHFCLYNNAFSSECEEISDMVKPYQKELQEMGKKSDFETARNLAFISSTDQMCYFIARSISEKIKESFGKLSFRDFAILDRSRKMRKTLVKYLSFFDIPYNLDAQTDIFDSAPVNDIYNLLRLCVYPSDRRAFASFLCSPFAGLSVKDVEIILSMDFALEKSDEKSIASVKNVLPEKKAELFENAVMLFYEIQKSATGNLLAKTITDLWYQYGYRYETLWHKNLFVESEKYDLLFELARRCDSDGVSLSYFIDEMDSLKSPYDDSELDIKEIEYPKESGNAVEIMTIHKSKGLQFPYVFIMDVTKDSRGDYSEKDENVTDETPFGDSNSVETEKAKSEFRRLVYVALTRAEKEAWIVGDSNKNKNSVMMTLLKAHYPESEDNPVYSLGKYTMNNGCPFDYISILPVDRNTINKKKINEKPLTLSEKSKFVSEKIPVYEKVKVITLESQMEPNPLVTPSSLEKGIEGTGAALESGNPVVTGLDNLLSKLYEKNFNAAHFGVFAHAFMESYVRNPENILQEIPVKVFRNLWDYNKSEEENYKTPLVNQMISVCKKMCEAFSKSRFAEELKTSVRKYPEYSFVANQNNCVVNGTIDLCYQLSDGKVVVVDYKTDEEMHPDKYYSQLACYKDAVSELFGVDKADVECHLFYLRYGKSVEVTAFANDSLLPKLCE